MITALLLVGLIAALAASAFFSGAETGVYCVDRVRLRVRADRGDARAKRLARLMDRREDLVITTLIGTNVADYFATVCVTALILRSAISEELAEVYATAILTPLILVFGGVLPKDWFQREADHLMYVAVVPLGLLRRAAAGLGLIALLRGLTRGLTRWIDPARATRDEELLPRVRMHRLLHEGAASGGLSKFQRDTIERVMRLSQVRVADVMAPRKRAATVSIDLPREDLLRIAYMAHFSRLPVYEKDPRRIVGVVNVYHVLMDDEPRPIREYVQEAITLRADDTVPNALIRLQKAQNVMAIITDPRGEFVGLLTMKDLAEEIVGELEAW